MSADLPDVATAPLIDRLAEEAPETPAQKLHPLTLLLNFIALIPSLGFAFVAIFWTAFDSDYNALLPIIVPVGFAIPMFFSWLSWSRFSYAVGEEDIKIQSGVLARKNRSIPYERIQDVSIEQNLLARILGLAAVKIETGGSSGQEDSLAAIALAEAERLRDLIRDRKAGLTSSPTMADAGPDDIAAQENETPIFAMDDRRVLTAGFFNFSFILLAVIGTIAQNLDFLLPGEIFSPRYWAGLWLDQGFVDDLSFGTQIFGIIGAIFSLVGIGVGSGIVTTYIREYRFRLDRVAGGFRRRRGLFTLTDMVMPIHRVQAAILRTGPIRSRFGWHHLKFQSLASDVSGETDHSAAPCAQMHELKPIFAEANIEEPADTLVFTGVDAAHWWRTAIAVMMLLSAIGTVNGLFVHPGLFALPLLIMPIALLMILHWRWHQYGWSETQLFVRTGWWRRKLTILPIRKVQSVDIDQSPWDHPLDLATVTIGVAGGSSMGPLRIHDVPLAMAEAIRTRLLGAISST